MTAVTPRWPLLGRTRRRDTDAHDQAARHDPVYDELAAKPEFAELRRRYRGFVIPATVGFLAWYRSTS